MSEHTKGRLHQCSHSDKRLRDEGGEWVADTDTARRKQEECSANARHLAAAWNACEGLSTENLESIVFVGETIRVRFDSINAELRQTQGELNAARALLREVLEGGKKSILHYEVEPRVRAYLDACDKPGGA